MSKSANLKTQEAFGAAVNSGNLAELNNLIAPGVIDHDPAANQGVGPQGFIAFFTEFRTAFPDLKIAPEQILADGDLVSLAYTVTGTHKGNFMGIPPTSRTIRARGLQIGKFNSDAKLVERWGSSDQLGIIQQITEAKGRPPEPNFKSLDASAPIT